MKTLQGVGLSSYGWFLTHMTCHDDDMIRRVCLTDFKDQRNHPAIAKHSYSVPRMIASTRRLGESAWNTGSLTVARHEAPAQASFDMQIWT